MFEEKEDRLTRNSNEYRDFMKYIIRRVGSSDVEIVLIDLLTKQDYFPPPGSWYFDDRTSEADRQRVKPDKSYIDNKMISRRLGLSFEKNEEVNKVVRNAMSSLVEKGFLKESKVLKEQQANYRQYSLYSIPPKEKMKNIYYEFNWKFKSDFSQVLLRASEIIEGDLRKVKNGFYYCSNKSCLAHYDYGVKIHNQVCDKCNSGLVYWSISSAMGPDPLISEIQEARMKYEQKLCIEKYQEMLSKLENHFPVILPQKEEVIVQPSAWHNGNFVSWRELRKTGSVKSSAEGQRKIEKEIEMRLVNGIKANEKICRKNAIGEKMDALLRRRMGNSFEENGKRIKGNNC